MQLPLCQRLVYEHSDHPRLVISAKMVSLKLVQVALMALTVAVQALPTTNDADSSLVKMSEAKNDVASRQEACPQCGEAGYVSVASF